MTTSGILPPIGPGQEQAAGVPRLPGSLIGQQARLQERLSSNEELFRQLPPPDQVIAEAPGIADEIRQDRGLFDSVLDSLQFIQPPGGAGLGLTSAGYLTDYQDLIAAGPEIERRVGEYEQLRLQIEWDGLLLGALTALPVTLQAFPGITADEWLSNVYPEREVPLNVRQTIGYIVTEINRDREERLAAAREEIARLEDPRGRLRDIWRLQPEQRSADELINAIISAGTYTRDAQLSPEELRSLFLEMGVPEVATDPEGFQAIQSRALGYAEQLRQQAAQNAILQEEGQRISAGEITSNWRRVQWARAIHQPALAIMRPIEWWSDKVNKPLSAGAVLPVAALEGLIGKWNYNAYNAFSELTPDALEDFIVSEGRQLSGPPLPRGPGDLEYEVRKAREQGYRTWEALQIGWDNWETNFFTKLGVELVVDPLNVIGIGLLTKITKGIPHVGKAVGASELALNQLAEAPFRGMKYLWVGDVSGRQTGRSALRLFQEQVGEEILVDSGFQGFARRLLQQKGDKIARESIQGYITVAETSYGKALGDISPSEHYYLVDYLTDLAISEPLTLDPLTRAGRMLLGYKVIGQDEALSLASRLAGVADDVGVYAGRKERVFGNFMEELNRIAEDTAGIGLGTQKFYASTDEAAKAIVRLFGADDTTSNATVIKTWMDGVRGGIKSDALSTFALDKSAFRQLFDAHANVRNSFVRAARSEINITRYRQGTISGLIGDLPEPFRLAWMSTIDRIITQPIARTYLLFPFYPVFNILEATIKMTLAGVNPLELGNPYYKNQLRLFGVDHLVPLRYKLPEERFNIQVGSYTTDTTQGYEVSDLLVDQLPGIQPTGRTGLLGVGQNLAAAADLRNVWYLLTRAYQEQQLMRRMSDVVTDAVGYNLGNRVVSAQNASLIGQLYFKNLRKLEPAVFDLVHSRVDEAAEVSGLNKLVSDELLTPDIAENMREAVFLASMSGFVDLTRNVPRNYPLSNAPVGAVEAIVREFTELPQIALTHALRGARDGRLYTQAGIDEIKSEMYEVLDLVVISSADLFVSNFERMSADMLRTPARSLPEAVAKVQMFNEGLVAFRGALSNSTQASIEYADKLTNTVSRSAFYNDLWNNSISPSITRFSNLVDQVSDNITDELRRIARDATDPAEKAAAESHSFLVDELTKHNVTWRAVAQNDIAIRAKYTTRSGPDYVAPRNRDDAWWSRFINEVRQNWNEGRTEIARQGLAVLKAKHALAGVDVALLPNTSDDILNAVHVAKLLGTTTEDLERNLYRVELKTMKPKLEFVSEVMNLAELSAERYNVDLADYGWTPERVENLYDSFMAKMTDNPDISPAVLALRTQVNGMMSEIQSMAINRGVMVNPQAQATYQSFADQVASFMDKPTIRQIDNTPTPAEALAEAERLTFRGLAFEHIDQLNQSGQVDMELLLNLRSRAFELSPEIAVDEDVAIRQINDYVGLLRRFLLLHGDSYDAHVRQGIEEQVRSRLLRETGEVDPGEFRILVNEELNKTFTLEDEIFSIEARINAGARVESIAAELRVIQTRISNIPNVGIEFTQEDVRSIMAQIRSVPDREVAQGAVRAFAGIRLLDDVNYPLIPNTVADEAGGALLDRPVIVMSQDFNTAMVQSMGRDGLEVFPDRVPGHVYDVDLRSTDIQIVDNIEDEVYIGGAGSLAPELSEDITAPVVYSRETGEYHIFDPSVIRVQGISSPGNYTRERDPMFPYTGTVREAELIPDPDPIDTVDPFEFPPTVAAGRELVPVSDIEQQEADRLLAGVSDYYKGLIERQRAFNEQYGQIERQIERLRNRTNRSINAARDVVESLEEFYENSIQTISLPGIPTGDTGAFAISRAEARRLNRLIESYESAPARVSARVPVIENGVERIRTRTVRNPELVTIWQDILNRISSYAELHPRFRPRDPHINFPQVEELLMTVRQVPTREVPEGYARVFHGTGTAQNFKQLLLRVPAAEQGGARGILSTYVTDDPAYAMVYTRRTDIGDTRDHMMVNVGEVREAAEEEGLGVLYDLDVDTRNAVDIEANPFTSRLDSELAEEMATAIANGAEVFRFDIENTPEYMVINPRLLNIRGKVTAQGYHPVEDVRQHIDLPGLRNTEEKRLFEATGDRPPLDSDQVTVDAHQRLISPEYQESRGTAVGEANLQAYQENPDYDNITAMGHVMKHVFPFWNYEAHRWAWWIPREMLRHPGVMAGWGKYQDSTDRGYIDVPGPLDADLTRGTIIGGAKRLLNRDYPEYHDRYPKTAEALDYMGRFGFYPGSPVGLFMSMFGAAAGGPQLGEQVPPLGRTLQGALASVAPENPIAELINEVIFPDRFRNYYIAHQVSTDSIQSSLGDYDFETLLAKQRAGTLTPEEAQVLQVAGDSINGSDILLKMLENIPLTPEEEAAWRRGQRKIGLWQILMEQTGIFRLQPDERKILRQQSQLLAEELTGVSVSVLEDMRQSGIRWEDVWGARSPELKTALNNLELYSHYTASTSLLPSQLSLAYTRNRHFWNTIQDRNLRLREELAEVETRVALGDESIKYWEDKYRDKTQRLSTAIEDLKETPIYRDVPISFEERVDFAERSGIKIAFHPLEELRAQYYEIELNETYDEELGRTVLDFDRFFAERSAVRSALTPNQLGRFENFINKNDTPLERLRYEIYNRFIRPYNSVRDVTLQSFDPMAQSIIRRSFVAVGDDRAELLEARDESGQQVVADYNARSAQTRESLRQSDPELDAWLLFWGRTQTVLTPQAQVIYDEILSEARRTGGFNSILREVLSTPTNTPTEPLTPETPS